MECKHCGANVGIEYRLCPYCKCELDYPTPNQQPVIIQNIIQPPMDNQGYNQNYNQNYQPQQDYNYQPPYAAPYQQDNALATVSPKSKIVTLLLAIFLGIFGVHRFYAGKYISGAVYLFTYGIFYCGWIFDIIMIAIGKFKDNNGLPIQK